jgi:hypothetical protein
MRCRGISGKPLAFGPIPLAGSFYGAKIHHRFGLKPHYPVT